MLRNGRKNLALLQGYFLGNGLFSFLLSPFNLLVDLISYRIPGVWKLDQRPQDYRREVDEVLSLFLMPVQSDQIFIECGDVKHYWHDNPLFIFVDTLLHRLVNKYDGRRYCVFMDIIRPSPVPAVLSRLLALVSQMVGSVKAIFYKNWMMIGATQASAASARQS